MKQIDEIKNLRDSGLSYTDISEKLNIPYNTVKSYLRRVSEPVVNTNNENKGYGHCKCCGKEIEQIIGKKEKVFCSPYCRLKFWRAKKSGK